MVMESPQSKTISGWVSADTKDAFTSQVKDRGHVQQRALDAALSIWVVLPDDLQATIMRSAPKSYEDFVELIRLRDLPAAIASLSEKQRRDLWSLLVEAHPGPGKAGRGKRR